MPLTYAAWTQESNLYVHTPEVPSQASLLLLDLRSEWSSRHRIDLFRDVPPQIRNVDTIVLRGGSNGFGSDLDRLSVLRTMMEERTQVLVLYPLGLDANGPMVESMVLRAPVWSGAPSSPLLSELRQLELDAIFARCRGFYADPSAHYLAPSSHHVAEFVRVANALQDPGDIARCADWLLERVPLGSAVLADTGTVMPLLLEARIRARLRQSEVSFDCLPAYPDRTAYGVRDVVDRLVARTPGVNVPFVSLVTVNSTGSLLRQMSDECPAGHAALVLCDTNEPGTPGSTSDPLFRRPIDRWAVGEDGRCAGCDGFARLLQVDPRTYAVMPAPLRRVAIRLSVGEASQQFWRIAYEAQAVRLHADVAYQGDRGRPRHYGIYLDVARLLQNEEFRAQCLKKLAEIPSPDLVVVPDHACTHELRALARSAFQEVSDERIRVLRGTELANGDLDGLGPESRVLLLDDALVGGQTLTAAKLHIYNAMKAVGPPRVHGFVLIDRLTETESRRIRNHFLDTREAKSARYLYGRAWQAPLPPAGRDSCPWCRENRVLADAVPHLSAGRDLANRRLARLRTEIDAPLLMRCVHARGRTLGSIFGPLDERTAFAAGTSALFASAEGLAEVTMNVEATIDNFYDDVFLAAVLRNAAKGKLRNLAYDGAVNAAVRRRSFDPNHVAELAWAAYEEKIPHSAIREVLAEVTGSHEELALLAELLELRTGRF